MPVLATAAQRLETARKLMDEFAARTGLTGTGGNIAERYLWTDAFAVQTFFGLAHKLGDKTYFNLALRLIEEVHKTLGRFRADDVRQGWISGLSEEEGRKHPTAGGLRIGKKLPERKGDEPFDEQLEWERDGQYFHYLTRWLQALLLAAKETRDDRYAVWAFELLQAGEMFIDKSHSRFRMFWKMSTDLKRPLITSMGEHDPLEMLISAVSASHALPEISGVLKPLIRQMNEYCRKKEWSTADALGIGALLLSTARVAELSRVKAQLPEALNPHKLFEDAISSLTIYVYLHGGNMPAEYRLAFRECGLSLGLRVISGRESSDLNLNELQQFLFLADDIESFWTKSHNHQASTWLEHEDINAVTLAASLIAKEEPSVFCGT